MNWWCLFPTIVLGGINEPSPPKDNGWKYLLIIFWEKDTHKIRVSGKDIFWFEERKKPYIPVNTNFRLSSVCKKPEFHSSHLLSPRAPTYRDKLCGLQPFHDFVEMLWPKSRYACGLIRSRTSKPKSSPSTHRHSGSSFCWMASNWRMTGVCWHSTAWWRSVQSNWSVCE